MSNHLSLDSGKVNNRFWCFLKRNLKKTNPAGRTVTRSKREVVMGGQLSKVTPGWSFHGGLKRKAVVESDENDDPLSTEVYTSPVRKRRKVESADVILKKVHQLPFLHRNLSYVDKRKYIQSPYYPKAKQHGQQQQWNFHITTVECNGIKVTREVKMELTAPKCPFCTRYSNKTITSINRLWMHLQSIHSEEFEFQVFCRRQGDTNHLVANPKEYYINSNGNSQSNTLIDISLLPGPGVTELIFYRNYESFQGIVQELSDLYSSIESKKASAPLRQYINPVMYDKVCLSQWLSTNDNNNDNKPSTEWQSIVENSALCDYSDVSEKEMKFFFLWNQFMKDNPILSQIQLVNQSKAFVRKHCHDFVTQELENQLISHLVNLVFEGVIGKNTLVECMDIYNAFVAKKQSTETI